MSYYGRSDFATVKEQQFAYLKVQNLRFSGGKPCGGADIAGWKKERNDDVQRLGNVFSALDVQVSAQELKSWQTDLADELIHQFDYSYNWKTEKIESLCDEETREFMGILQERGSSRRLLLTAEGHLGYSIGTPASGDFVCLIEGANVPYILRATKNGRYQLIGEAYVHGMMHGGTAVDKWNSSETIIVE